MGTAVAGTGGTVSEETGRRVDLLASCRLFSGVGAEVLEHVAARATEIGFPAGHVIARQNEIGTGFFVVMEGRVRVIRDGRRLAELGPGDFFGELSVLDGQPRNAQVVAIGPCRCLALASWDLEALLTENPPLALAIIRGLAARLRATTEQATH
jgi:CRP-like cAMP-binding protein